MEARAYVKQNIGIYDCEGTRTHNHVARKRTCIQFG